MAAKAGQPSSDKGNPVTVMVNPASGSQTPSVRLAATVGSGKVPPLLQTVETVPGTVLISLLQAKTSSSGRKKAVGTKATKATKNATAKPPPQPPPQPPPSKYKVTAPRRMETRSRGKLVEKESSKSRKRKLPAKSSRPASDHEKSPKKSKVSPDKKAKKKSVSGSKPGSPQKSIPQKKGVDTNQVIPKATVHPRTSTSAVNVGSGSSTFDVKVELTPSETIPHHEAHQHSDHSYMYSNACSTNELKELKAQAKKDAKMVEKLIKDRRMLRMRVFRANKKNDKLMKSILLEQKMHKETRQTLKAIMQGLQLQLKTV